MQILSKVAAFKRSNGDRCPFEATAIQGTLGLLLQLEALKKLLDGEWLGHPATWVAALMVVAT